MTGPGALATVSGILNTMVSLAAPFLYAGIGEVICQTSGVVNLGVDGIMLLSAFAAFYATLTTGSLALGVLAGALTGLAMGLLMSSVSVSLKAEQGVSGIGLSMLGLGLSSLLFKVLVGGVKTVGTMPPLPIPLLSSIPFLGPVFFKENLLVYGAFLLVPAAWLFLEKTQAGVKLKAVGQNPAAADSVGISVNRVRYLGVCLGATLAGLAGASLSIGHLGLFQDNLTAGQGFIAVALVYFGGWRPAGVLAGALLFSAANSFQLWMQVLGAKVPPSLAVMLPYLLTILALTLTANRARQPAALNKRFERGEG
jgi:general nucleoside transport system permease protein